MPLFGILLCLRLQQWPEKEFFHRLEASVWLGPAVLRDLEQFGLHVVPVGVPGSSTEASEWRLSFSRAEAIAVLLMAPVQKRTLLALKRCKQQMGQRASIVKSYLSLTALFWTCHEMPLRQWTSLRYSAHCVLSRLQDAADARFFPCFFMVDINVLLVLTSEEMDLLSESISLMQQRFAPLLLQSLVGFRCGQHLLWPLLESGCATRSEDQLRTRLVRGVITAHLRFTPMLSPLWMFSSSLPALLRGLNRPLLDAFKRDMSLTAGWRGNIHLALLLALTMAPAATAHRVTLTRTSLVSWSWDAAPLMQLLTDGDVDGVLLGQRSAVFRWCYAQNALAPEQREVGPFVDPCTPRGLTSLLVGLCWLRPVLPEIGPSVLSSVNKLLADRVALISQAFVSLEQNLQRMESACLHVKEFAQHHLGMDKQAAQRLADRWIHHFNSLCEGEGLRVKHERLYSRIPDPWLIAPYQERLFRT